MLIFLTRLKGAFNDADNVVDIGHTSLVEHVESERTAGDERSAEHIAGIHLTAPALRCQRARAHVEEAKDLLGQAVADHLARYLQQRLGLLDANAVGAGDRRIDGRERVALLQVDAAALHAVARQELAIRIDLVAHLERRRSNRIVENDDRTCAEQLSVHDLVAAEYRSVAAYDDRVAHIHRLVGQQLEVLHVAEVGIIHSVL